MTAPPKRDRLRIMVLVLMVIVTGVAGFYFVFLDYGTTRLKDSKSSQETAAPKLAFVGKAVCVGCHIDQDRLWQGSHHDLAMQEASEQAVLGDFQDADFSKDGVVSRFFRQNGRFMVRTDGPDGKLADFQIKYTFGVSPLQQYLIELPGGKLQALSIAWDSRPKDSGGQVWFHLYPDEKIDYRDELHWTRRSQNWNFMCAECHSTHLEKNYDAASRTYQTTWSDIDVSCEACHGPGSRHVDWAKLAQGSVNADSQNKGFAVLLTKQRGVVWSIDPQSGNARRNRPRGSNQEIEICARCHSRRAQLFADYRYGPLLDTHLPALLKQTLYHADGQIDGEVYEYGSFLQSKMYQAGVTCSNCHEPHSLKLRVPGNGVCLQCHAENKYDNDKHHFHKQGDAGSRCVSCHMQAKTYMGVDVRHDHSFRIPRPDLSEKIGTPNACNACHSDKPAQWTAGTVRKWYGHDPKGYQDYAEALYAARAGGADAKDHLLALLQDKTQPAIARATAISELSAWLVPDMLPVLTDALQDSEPLLRSAGLELLEQLPPEQRWSLAHDRLRDPERSLRALAAAALAGVSQSSIFQPEQSDYASASSDYLNSLALNADDPAAEVNRGNFHTARKEFEKAEGAYREALHLDPGFVTAYINLADLFRLTQHDSDGQAVLEQGLARLPNSAELHHSLGLLLARRNNIESALESLARAARLAPGQARFSYVYAVALINAGRIQEARKVVLSALSQAPNDPALNNLNTQFTTEE